MGGRVVSTSNINARQIVRRATRQVLLFTVLAGLIYSVTGYVASISLNQMWILVGVALAVICGTVGMHSAFQELTRGILRLTGTSDTETS